MLTISSHERRRSRFCKRLYKSSDASAKESNLGAAVVGLDRYNNIQRAKQISIGTAKHWSVHAAELIAIYYAVDIVEDAHSEDNCEPNSQDQTFTIVSDSKSAL